MSNMTKKQRVKSFKCLNKVIDSMEEKERGVISIDYLKLSMKKNGWKSEKINKFMEDILPKERNGKQKAFFKRLGIQAPSMAYWIEAGQIPEKRCYRIVQIAEEWGVHVTLNDLRPDVFDKV